MFFSRCAGGQRKRIDYVLVYGRDAVDDQRRREFEEELVESGLQLEYEDIEVQFPAAVPTAANPALAVVNR